MKEALLAGEPCDVMIVTDAMIDALAVERRARRRDRARALGRVRTGVAVRAGDAAARRSTAPEALRAALLAADAHLLPRSAARDRRHPFRDGARASSASHDALAPRLRDLSERRDRDARARRSEPTRCADRLHAGHRDPLHRRRALVGALPAQFELATVYTRRGRRRAPPIASWRAASSRCSPGEASRRAARAAASSSSRASTD